MVLWKDKLSHQRGTPQQQKKKKPQAGKKKDNKQKREVTKNGFSSKGLKGSNWGIKKIVNE